MKKGTEMGADSNDFHGVNLLKFHIFYSGISGIFS
jgi:hypothetical protein